MSTPPFGDLNLDAYTLDVGRVRDDGCQSDLDDQQVGHDAGHFGAIR